jgi:hypothetical protein
MGNISAFGWVTIVPAIRTNGIMRPHVGLWLQWNNSIQGYIKGHTAKPKEFFSALVFAAFADNFQVANPVAGLESFLIHFAPPRFIFAVYAMYRLRINGQKCRQKEWLCARERARYRNTNRDRWHAQVAFLENHIDQRVFTQPGPFAEVRLRVLDDGS